MYADEKSKNKRWREVMSLL